MKRQVWRRLRSTSGEPPEVGSTIEIQLNELVRDRENKPLAEGWTGVLVNSTVVTIGAHWSNQPRGEAGWYAFLEFECPENLRNKELA